MKQLVWADLPDPEVDAEKARSVADDVLARRAYVDAARPPSLWERFQNWLFEMISDLFALLTSSGGRGFVAWIIIAVFVVLVAWLFFRLARSAGPVPQRDVAPDPTLDLTEGRSPDEWMSEAAAAEANGDWRAGLRCRHRALVTELIDRDVVAARPGLTAGEVAVHIGESVPVAAQAVDEVTLLFKDAWYGGVPVGPPERDRFAQLATEVLAQTARVPS